MINKSYYDFCITAQIKKTKYLIVQVELVCYFDFIWGSPHSILTSKS